MLDVAYAVLTEGMDAEQREKFDQYLQGSEGSGDHDAARRAYALAYGELS